MQKGYMGTLISFVCARMPDYYIPLRPQVPSLSPMGAFIERSKSKNPAITPSYRATPHTPKTGDGNGVRARLSGYYDKPRRTSSPAVPSGVRLSTATDAKTALKTSPLLD